VGSETEDIIMKAKYAIGAIIIIVFLVWGATAFMNTTVQYVSIAEAAESPRTVQVLGKVDFDRVDYDVDHACLKFEVFDAEADDASTAERMPVVYYGVVPGNFDQASSVVLKGKPGDDGVFVADQILVKCPSKYQGEDGREYQDLRKHEEAVGGGTGV
jgi:cytochrome c-type biogenesis protein CcmE